MGKSRKKGKSSASRKFSAKTALCLCAALVIWGLAAEWFVHHSRGWLDRHEAAWPRVAVSALYLLGNPLADITDALGWTGHDAVYEYDEEAPENRVLFAGAPTRIAAPAPNDVRVLDRGEFLIGWSDSLRHPLWCAYHVTREKKFEDGKRPSFLVDRSVPLSPHPDDYSNSGYDRGHMAPNHAIVSRYGDAERRKTFLMSNIAPQSPELNRGVWRDLEHRIADLWTARYGEIWVVAGTIPSSTERKMGSIDLPDAYYQVVVAQEGMNVRAFAVLLPNDISWNSWAARYLVSIEDLEEATGLNFNPDLPDFIARPLEAELPSRLWPVRTRDILSQVVSSLFTN